MRKMTRKVTITSYDLIMYDSDTLETWTEHREVEGSHTERGLYLLEHSRSPTIKLMQINNIKQTLYIITISDEDFIKYGRRKEILP